MSKRLNAIVERFNRKHPIGSRVRCWSGLRSGASIDTKTRSPASLLGGHTPVVWVEGHAGCISLAHVEVLPEETPCAE